MLLLAEVRSALRAGDQRHAVSRAAEVKYPATTGRKPSGTVAVPGRFGRLSVTSGLPRARPTLASRSLHCFRRQKYSMRSITYSCYPVKGS